MHTAHSNRETMETEWAVRDKDGHETGSDQCQNNNARPFMPLYNNGYDYIVCNGKQCTGWGVVIQISIMLL